MFICIHQYDYYKVVCLCVFISMIIQVKVVCPLSDIHTLTRSEVMVLSGISLEPCMCTSCSSATIHGKSWRTTTGNAQHAWLNLTYYKLLENPGKRQQETLNTHGSIWHIQTLGKSWKIITSHAQHARLNLTHTNSRKNPGKHPLVTLNTHASIWHVQTLGKSWKTVTGHAQHARLNLTHTVQHLILEWIWTFICLEHYIKKTFDIKSLD